MFGDLAMNLLPGDYPEILQGTKKLIFPWFKVNSVNTHLPGLRIQQKSVSTSRGKRAWGQAWYSLVVASWRGRGTSAYWSLSPSLGGMTWEGTAGQACTTGKAESWERMWHAQEWRAACGGLDEISGVYREGQYVSCHMWAPDDWCHQPEGGQTEYISEINSEPLFITEGLGLRNKAGSV